MILSRFFHSRPNFLCEFYQISLYIRKKKVIPRVANEKTTGRHKATAE